MEVSGEVADLMVKEGLEVTTEAAKLAGKGIVNVTALLAALLKQNYKTVGQASVERLNRENAEAVVIPLKQEDRKQFKALAKKYGVLYVAVKKRGEDTGVIDIISNTNYAAQLNAVLESMGYAISPFWRAWATPSRRKNSPRRNRPQKKRPPALHKRHAPSGAGVARSSRRHRQLTNPLSVHVCPRFKRSPGSSRRKYLPVHTILHDNRRNISLWQI